MKKENLKDEKIQADVTEKIKSENLPHSCEQDSKEKLDEPAWRSLALAFLNMTFDHEETTLISYQYSKLLDDKWTPFVPYNSYIHFTSPEINLASIILGSLDNLDVGIYRFKFLSIYYYRYYWHQHIVEPEFDYELYPVLELNVFERNGVKGFEVIDCYDIEEKIVKNEI